MTGNLTIICLMFIVAACGGLDEQQYNSRAAYLEALDRFILFTEKCEANGRIIIIPYKHSSRIKRVYTLEDMRTARCM